MANLLQSIQRPPKNGSWLSWLALQPPQEQKALLAKLNEDELASIEYDWLWNAREAQYHPDGFWRIWVILAGRGFGKTRTGAEWVKWQVEVHKKRFIALVGATSGDVRAIMIEGESGILAVSNPAFMPEYQPSKRRIIWPNGAQAFLYNAESPERLRGPQHDAAWCDELASWKYDEKTWDNLRFTMRLGDDPRYLITTTPKPRKLLKKILKMKGTVITGGSTYENSLNLNKQFLEDLKLEYEGTRVGRQELHAEVLDDVPGALWNQDTIAANRVSEHPPLRRIAVAIDPAVTSEDSSAETGIMVGGIDDNGHGYLLEDASIKATPMSWGKRAVEVYERYDADIMIGEANNGGDMIELTIKTVDDNKIVRFKKVHASKGKHTRAEPISALDEQGRIHHVGIFPKLEEQMTSWDPELNEKSPDRLDARVWLFTELMLKPKREFLVV